MDKKEVLQNRKNIRDSLKAKLFLPQKPQIVNNSIVSTEGEEKIKEKKIKTKSFQNVYTLVDDAILGEGAHAVVKQCVQISNQKKFAVKIQRSGDPEVMNQNLKSYRLQKMINHPNVIKVHELFLDEQIERIYFVMELCTFPSLKQILRKQHYIQENMARILIKTILNALDAIHQKGICHRDLKPDNILVHQTDFNKIKIIDFGISSKFKVQNIQKNEWQRKCMWTKTGTLQYMAPEMFTFTNYDESVDMWALGIITYEILCGSPPFVHEYIMETQEQICNCQYSFDTQIPEIWVQQKQKANQLKQMKKDGLETIDETSDQKNEETPLLKEKNQVQREFSDHMTKIESQRVTINIWDTISASAKDFIKRLIKPNKRLNIKAALLHPWFTSEIQPSSSKKSLIAKDDIVNYKLTDSHLNNKLLQSTPIQYKNFLESQVNTMKQNQITNSKDSNTSSSSQNDVITKSKLMSKDDIFINKKEINGGFVGFNPMFNRMDNSEYNKSFKSSNVISQNSSIAKSEGETNDTGPMSNNNSDPSAIVTDKIPKSSNINNFLLNKNDFKFSIQANLNNNSNNLQKSNQSNDMKVEELGPEEEEDQQSNPKIKKSLLDTKNLLLTKNNIKTSFTPNFSKTAMEQQAE